MCKDNKFKLYYKKYSVDMTPLGLPLTAQWGRANNNKTISYKLEVV